MKNPRRISASLIGILLLAIALLFLRKNISEREKPESPVPNSPTAAEISASNDKPAETNLVAAQAFGMRRIVEMTDAERAELANKFKEKFKPAADKWFKAYEGHISFGAEDLTFEKFHSRLGSHMYTFMIDGDTTLTFQDSKDPKGIAKVSYLMSRKAAIAMNQLPTNGFVPNLHVPVTSKDVINMVKMDSGVEFKPNEVLIKPTAAASALNGGAFVDILPTGKDPNNGINYIISMVFGPDGNLVNYERDPFF